MRFWGLAFGTVIWAQGVKIQGKVETLRGEPLGQALIRLPASGFQTLAQQDGRFVLFLESGRHPIEIRYLGYRPLVETLQAEGPGPVERVFRLSSQEIRVGGVIITEGGANPADLLIREAIRRKRQNRACLPTYRTEVYSLFTVRLLSAPWRLLERLARGDSLRFREGDIVYMSEALSDVDYAPPKRFKETIKRSRVVGSRGYGFTGLWVLQGFDPYAERLAIPEITQSPLVLPLADDAPLYYRYQLVGEIWDEEGLAYKIRFEPRGRSPGIRGDLVLADESYAIRAFEAKLTSADPVQYVDTIYFQMVYVPVSSCWVPANTSFRARLSLAVLGAELSFLAKGYFLHRRYSLLALPPSKKKRPKGVPSPSLKKPDSLLSPQARFAVDTIQVGRLDFREQLRIVEGAGEASTAFWDSLRQAPLDSQQIAYLAAHDSLVQKQDTALAKTRKGFQLTEEGLMWARQNGQSGPRLKALVLWPGYTHREGWVWQLQFSYQRRAWQAQLRFRYGNRWGRLLPLAEWRYTFRRSLPMSLVVRVGAAAYEFPEQPQIPLYWNTLYYLVRRYAPLAVYEWQGVVARWRLHWQPQWSLTAQIAYDRRPLTSASDGYYQSPRFGLNLHWQPNARWIRMPNTYYFLPPTSPFELQMQLANEWAYFSERLFWTGALQVDIMLSISPWGKLFYQGSGAYQALQAPWGDRLFPSVQPLAFHRYYGDLAFWPLYQPAGLWLLSQQFRWDLEGAFLRWLPLLRKTSWHEEIVWRTLYTEGRWHVEGAFYLTQIALSLRRTSLFKGLSLGLHYGLAGYQAGLWRLTLAIGNPTSRTGYPKPNL